MKVGKYNLPLLLRINTLFAMSINKELKMFDFRIFFTVFGTVFISELGDKTQLATFLFASTESGAPMSVFLGSACALVVSSALAVLGAGVVGKYVNPTVINNVAGIGFIVIGVWILINRG